MKKDGQTTLQKTCPEIDSFKFGAGNMKESKIKKKEKLPLIYILLAFYVASVFINKHPALFISDYYLPLIIFSYVSSIALLLKGKLRFNNYTIPFVLLVAILLISSVLFLEIFDRGVFLSYLVWYIFMFLAVQIPHNCRSINYLIQAFIIGSLIISLIVLIAQHQYLFDGSFRYTIQIGNNVDVDPNYLASYLYIGFAFCLYNISFSKFVNRFSKMLYVIFALIILFAVFMTGSRSAYLAVGILTIGYFLELRKSMRFKKRFYLFFLIPIIVFSIFLVVENYFPDQILSRFDLVRLNDTSNANRLLYWKYALESFLHSPIIGFGAALTTDIILKYTSHVGDAHNTYLTFLLNFGLVGLLIVILWIWRVMKELIINRNKFWISFVISFFLNSFIIANQLGISFWIPLLLIYYMSSYKEEYFRVG